MTDAQQVQVFNFRIIEGHPENQRVAAYKATLAHIRAVGGQSLPATKQAVAVDELDAEGRYRRLPTGWAELS